MREFSCLAILALSSYAWREGFFINFALNIISGGRTGNRRRSRVYDRHEIWRHIRWQCRSLCTSRPTSWQQPEEQAKTARPGVVVVTSAMSGVTNLLIEAAQRAAAGDESFYHEAENTLRIKHQLVAGQLIDDGTERATWGIFSTNACKSSTACAAASPSWVN